MSKKQVIQVPVQIVGFNPKADRSWKLVFETRELSGAEVQLLADNFQGEGWMVFSPNGEIAVEDVPSDLADAGVKTEAQKQRSMIYLMWKQKGGKGDFESYYRTVMARIREFISERLEDS